MILLEGLQKYSQSFSPSCLSEKILAKDRKAVAFRDKSQLRNNSY